MFKRMKLDKLEIYNNKYILSFRSLNILRGSFHLGGLGLFRQKNSLDIRQNATLSNGHTSQKLIQLFVITNRQLKMTRNDPGLLVITCSITRQFQDLSS
uniref:Putative LOC101105787 [Ovis aries] n=1 Tax=Lepeophtheirus salmonis TaxID=72036 RepID=A0A0K2U0S2_LEPSM